jgi:hypothetical protein
MAAKATPLEAFQDNMRDAHLLVTLAEGLTNSRARRMRRELRERVGAAWKVPSKLRDQLDCLESADVYLTFKPGSRLSRQDFVDHRPLLRQALVAACAATETYLADKIMCGMAELTKSPEAATERLGRLSLSVEDWLYIEKNYKYRRRGLHVRVIERRVREFASTSPTKVGELLSLAGVPNPQKQLDHHRQVAKGDTYALLDRVTQRRNKIVHTGDRSGRTRAALTIGEVKEDLAGLESVVSAIERVL